jgi:hypothetical protein
VAGLPGWVRWLASSFLVLQRCTAKIRAPERGTSLRCFPAAISAMTGPTCIVDALGLAVRACSSVTFAAISLPCRDTRSLRSWRYPAPDAFRGFGDRRKRAPPRTLGPSWSPGMVLKWCDRNALSCACGNVGKICQCRRRVLCSSGHLTVHGPKLMSSRTVTRPLSQRIGTRSSTLRTGLAISRVGGYVGMHPG